MRAGVVSLLVLWACGAEAPSPSEAPPAPAEAPAASSAPSGGAAPTPAPAPSAPPAPSSPSQPDPVGPYPLVFLHGMAGFVELGAEPFELAYFRGVQAALAEAGEQAFFLRASPYASSRERAAQLEPQLREVLARTGAAKVNLVAHSQGGLDARILASPRGLGLGAQIASVTTVSTPHHGTKVADLTLRALGAERPSLLDPAVEVMVRLLGYSLYDLSEQDAADLRLQLIDLSEAGAADFNALYTDDVRVVYRSYAGRTNLRRGREACAGGQQANDEGALDPTAPALQPTATYLEGNPLDPNVNDGLVPVLSARYGRFVQCVPADHLDQMGYASSVSFSAPAFYRQLVAALRTHGL